ncbi:TetR/AcrR family transcriptional regulator [Bacillus cihuensis]|uniref:TetR/AcrR family transcriptional regulator n=1 Tax=Bacillus cihuensis TaxID=1208599 RepID=UPI0003FC5CCE|nr:TetR/AcrR family transcriptional regulator [Bacillus cihuensis]
MRADKIKQVAMDLFAKKGYEGTSLVDIAEAVGIKKPSIYGHYSGKDELFLQIVKDVFDEETKNMYHFFEENAKLPLESKLYRILYQYKDRYGEDERLRFLVRMLFFPPAHLQEEVVTVYVYPFLDCWENQLVGLFKQAALENQISQIDPKLAASAFMGVMDAVMVEIVYSDPVRFLKRLNASWPMYWLALKPK